jgi:outer membrane protein TolC
MPAPTGTLPVMTESETAVASLNDGALNDLALNNRSDLKAARQYIAAALTTHRGAEDSKSPVLTLQLDPTRAIVVYSQSLENNLGEGRAAEALSLSRQSEVALHQLETQVQVDIGDCVRNLHLALAEWKDGLKAQQQTLAAVENDEKRARFGVIDRKLLLQTKDQLTQIETDVVNAELLFASNMAMLRLVTGTVHPGEETPAKTLALFTTLPGSD